MRGLALEGGGAKGAYQIGVAKALLENGYEFDGFVGTSIGAVNAAALAQGDIETALSIWLNISMDKLFGRNLLTKIISERAINTDKIKALIEQSIDEKKVRASGKDFGLVTISRNDFKPHKLMLEDIPEGQLINYIMASASFPGFRSEKIDDASFLDGAFYDNCPYGLLYDKGYDEIIVIRTNAHGVFRKVRDSQIVKVISPVENLGHMMRFSQKRSERNIKLGYFDGLRYAQGLRGMMYYIKPFDMPKDYDYSDFIISLLEFAARERGIERFRVYDYAELCAILKERPLPHERKTAVDRLIDEIITCAY